MFRLGALADLCVPGRKETHSTMKKAILAAALAALALGAAQAVTIDWADLAGNNKWTDKTGRDSGTLSLTAENKAWTAACLIDITTFADSNGAYPVLFGVLTDSSTEATRFYYSGSSNTLGSIIKHTASDNAGFSQAPGWQAKQMAAGSYEFVFSFDGKETLSMYVDGTLYGTVSGFPAWDSITVVLGQQRTNGGQVLGGTWNADMYVLDGMTYAEAKATAIPEPTALALLALGVAGVALRRKVA